MTDSRLKAMTRVLYFLLVFCNIRYRDSPQVSSRSDLGKSDRSVVTCDMSQYVQVHEGLIAVGS